MACRGDPTIHAAAVCGMKADSMCVWEQKRVVQKRDLAAWEKEHGGRTAEEVARRVVVKFRPSEEEFRVVRNVGQRPGGGGGQGGDGSGNMGGAALAASGRVAEAADEDKPGDAAGEGADGMFPFRV